MSECSVIQPDVPRRNWINLGEEVRNLFLLGFLTKQHSDHLTWPRHTMVPVSDTPSQPETPKDSGAGQAFAERLRNDPEARSAWLRVALQLRMFGDASDEPFTPELKAELQRCRREFASEFAKAVEAEMAKLSAVGFQPPQTIEDWEHLARIVELPYETIQSGNYTAADVHALALAWVERERLKIQIARQFATVSESPSVRAPSGGSGDEDAGHEPLRKMKSSVRLAGASFEWVEREKPELSPPANASTRYCRAQWSYIREHYDKIYSLDKHNKSTIPAFKTWGRYVREYLRLKDGPKNSPRAGRSHGGSIVRPDEIDGPRQPGDTDY